MNNEIIELLLYKLEQNYKCEKEECFILYKSDIKDLLDYITNLQQENKKLKEAYERLTEDYVKKEYIVKAIENVFNEVKGDEKNE